MMFHATPNKTLQVLKDLIKINNDRIAVYQSALNQANLDASIQDTFSEIITEGVYYRQQLTQELNNHQSEIKNTSNILGKIYMAWSDLKVTFATNTQRAILSSCMYNEEIALHAYEAAITNDSGINRHILDLLKEHEEGLRKNYKLLKCFYEMRKITTSALMYFV